MEALLDEGVAQNELPSGERICRELAEYPKAEQAKIYRRARELALAAGKVQPDTMSVREAAVQIEGTKATKERHSNELIQKIEGIMRALKISIGWEAMEPREVARLKKALGYVIAYATTLLRSAPAKEDSSADAAAESGDDPDQ